MSWFVTKVLKYRWRRRFASAIFFPCLFLFVQLLFRKIFYLRMQKYKKKQRKPNKRRKNIEI